MNLRYKNCLFSIEPLTGRHIEAVAHYGPNGPDPYANEREVIFLPNARFRIAAVDFATTRPEILLTEFQVAFRMSAQTIFASTAAGVPVLPVAEQHAAVVALIDLMTRAEGPALDAFLELANVALRSQPADVPKAEKAALMRLVVYLQRREEEAELAAAPASSA